MQFMNRTLSLSGVAASLVLGGFLVLPTDADAAPCLFAAPKPGGGRIDVFTFSWAPNDGGAVTQDCPEPDPRLNVVQQPSPTSTSTPTATATPSTATATASPTQATVTPSTTAPATGTATQTTTATASATTTPVSPAVGTGRHSSGNGTLLGLVGAASLALAGVAMGLASRRR